MPSVWSRLVSLKVRSEIPGREAIGLEFGFPPQPLTVTVTTAVPFRLGYWSLDRSRPVWNSVSASVSTPWLQSGSAIDSRVDFTVPTWDRQYYGCKLFYISINIPFTKSLWKKKNKKWNNYTYHYLVTWKVFFNISGFLGVVISVLFDFRLIRGINIVSFATVFFLFILIL